MTKGHATLLFISVVLIKVSSASRGISAMGSTINLKNESDARNRLVRPEASARNCYGYNDTRKYLHLRCTDPPLCQQTNCLW